MEHINTQKESEELLNLLTLCTSSKVAENQRVSAELELYKRCKPIMESMLYKYTHNKHLAQTVYNESILLLLKKNKEGEIVQDVKAYLYVLAKGVYMNAIKPELRNAARYSTLVDGRHGDHLPSDGYESDYYMEMEGAVSKGLELLNKSKPDQAQVLKAFFIEELSYRQVMEKYGYDLNQIKSLVQNGKVQLRKIITAHNLLPQITDK